MIRKNPVEQTGTTGENLRAKMKRLNPAMQPVKYGIWKVFSLTETN
jgi:hypothetical protein